MKDELALPLIDAALGGNEQALAALVAGVQDEVYRLALRMLGQRADAQDATQEILIRIVTSLVSFERRSAFSTWVYSVAANHLRDAAARRQSRSMASLDAMAEQLAVGIAMTSAHDPASLDDPALQLEARELGLRCTQGMLMCLDVDHRLPLVLTEIFGLGTAQGAEVLGISAPAYRQRLSRGRRRLERFIEGRCGWIDPGAACTCPRQALAARQLGAPVAIRWAGGETAQQRRDALDAGYDELALMQRIASALRRTPQWSAPQEVAQRLHSVMAASPMLGGACAAGEA